MNKSSVVARLIAVGLVLVLVSTMVAFVCSADIDYDMTYEEAAAKMMHLAEKIDDVVFKTTRSILKAKHFHQMEKQALQADAAVERVLQHAEKLVQEAKLLGIVLTQFDIEVFNEAVGRWVKFDPIHLTSSGN